MFFATVYLKNIKWYEDSSDANHPAEATRAFEIEENEDHTVNVEELLSDIRSWLRDNINDWLCLSYNAEFETADGTRIPLRSEDGKTERIDRIDIDRITEGKKYSILNWNLHRQTLSFATNRTDYTLSEAREALKDVAIKCMIKYKCVKDEELAKTLYEPLVDRDVYLETGDFRRDRCYFYDFYKRDHGDNYQIVETPLGKDNAEFVTTDITESKKYSILNLLNSEIPSFATNRTDYTLSEAREALKEIALKCMVKYECAKDKEEAKTLYKSLLDGNEEMESVGVTENCVSLTTYCNYGKREDRYQIVETPLS